MQLGVVYFLSTTFLHSEVRFLFPYSQRNMPALTENTQAGRQAGREGGTSTHTHTHFVSHRIRLTEKGNLDHHGTVKLSIKAQSNDVSSLLYLFKGWGRSYIRVYTLRHAQIVIFDHQLSNPNPNLSPGLLKIAIALK